MDTDGWTQRLKENPPDPLEAIRQEHEGFLSELEALAVEAIAINDWSNFYSHVVSFQNEYDLHGESVSAIGEDERDCGASTKDLTRPGADSFPTTVQ